MVASYTVHSNAKREAALSLGGLTDSATEAFAFSANLQAGRVYRFQLEATCSVYSGLLGTVSHCVFGPSDLYDPGFVEWTAISIRF